MYILNNIKININTDQVINSVTYPAGTLLMRKDEWTKLGLIEVADPTPPDSRLFTFVENPDGSYTTTPRDPAVIAAEDTAVAERVKNSADAIAAKQYAKLVTLMGMTPAEIQTWIDTNVTTLATAKDAIKTLAVAISVLARKL